MYGGIVMKKKIASILVCSMIMSAAACAKTTESTTTKATSATTTESTVETTLESTEETTTTSESKAETTTTETSESEATTSATEETTAKETTTEASTSEETTAPSETKAPAKDVKYDSSLTNLPIQFEQKTHGYAIKNPTKNEYPEIEFVDKQIIYFSLNDSSNKKLNESVNSFFDKFISQIDEAYKKELEKLLNASKEGKESETSSFYPESRITRADDQFCSFVVRNPESDIPNFANFNTKTGEQIKFEDVVLDKEALAKYLEDAMKKNERITWMVSDGLVSKIRNGNPSFALTYDGIYVQDDYYAVKISAIHNPSWFNMDFFGSSPKYYCIESDVQDVIDWDIDGDGKTDTITIDITESDYHEFDKLTINVNGKENVLKPDLGEDFYGCYDCANLIKTDKGFYLCITTTVEDDESDHTLFKISKDGTLEQKSSFGGFISQFYDPSEIVMHSRTDIAGTSYFLDKITLIGTDGKIKATSSGRTRVSHALLTRQDISGKLVKDDGSEGKEFTIPAGTAVVLNYFDSKMKMIDITVMTEQGIGETIRVPYDDSDYPCKINGVEDKELLMGLTFAG